MNRTAYVDGAEQRFNPGSRRTSSRLTSCNYITNLIVMYKNYMRAIPREWRGVSKVFAALGDEHRQRILLTFGPGEELTVGQIVEVAPLSRSAVSHHLRILRESGILRSRKAGKEVYLSIDKAFLGRAISTLLEFVQDKA